MNKKIMGLMVAGVAVFALSGCGGGGDDYYVPPQDVNYLTYANGHGIVPSARYECIDGGGITDSAGAFIFNPDGDICEFEFYDQSIDLYIDSDFGFVDGLHYECASGSHGVTGYDTFGDFIAHGYFEHDPDDMCTFHF